METVESLRAAGRRRLAAELLGLWSSRSLRLALALMLFGGVLWVRDHRPAVDGVPIGTNAVVAPATVVAPVPPGMRSPATFRFGAGFAGGFLLGFAFRRFLKTTSALAALVLGGMALLKLTGLIELDWASLEGHVRESLAWTHGQAEALKALLTGYLPSAGAGGFGLWKGIRTRPVTT